MSEFRYTIPTVFFMLLSLKLHVEATCPSISGCTFQNSECTSVKCVQYIDREELILEMKINTCEEQISITESISVPALGFHFSYTFNGDDEIPIPGLNFLAAKVFMRVKISRDENKRLELKVLLVLKVLSREIKSITVLDKDLGYIGRSIECGFMKWLDDQPIGVKAAVYGGFCILLCSIIGCIACCCKKRRNPGGIIMFGNQSGNSTAMTELPDTATAPYAKF